MSKQTINIGASPNDGTGTPLRTSFDYCNLNFTEIYTALGGGVALPGATTQVIFNDGGTNLAGDAGLVYNKTTDALTVAGLVTAGSATITGDLTVDTNVLKVDTTNNRVGVLNTPTVPFEVTGLIAASGSGFQAGAANGIFAGLNNDGTNPGLDLRRWTGTANNHGTAYIATSSSGDALFYTDAQASNTKATSLRMTLNSTGLGIGGTAIGTKLEVVTSTSGSLGGTATVTNSAAAAIGNAASFNFRTNTNFLLAGYFGARIEAVTPAATNDTDLVFYNYKGVTASGDETMRITSGGNVGVGVTPSAWGGGGRAFEIGFIGTGIQSRNNQYSALTQNSWFNSSAQWIYGATGLASRYDQDAGTHKWFTAPSGTAGNAITFTQAMTLDASGNLLVGTTGTNGSASNSVKNVGGVFSTVNGATGSTATGVAATLFTAPSEAVFIVSAYIVGSASPANYNAVAIVRVSGGTAAITTISTASNLTISLSGLNVQATQTSGINQAFAYSAIRIS